MRRNGRRESLFFFFGNSLLIKRKCTATPNVLQLDHYGNAEYYAVMTAENTDPLVAALIDRLRVYVEGRRGRGREIAAQLGVEPQSVSDWLSGRTEPTLANGLRLMKILARQRRVATPEMFQQ
jgi:DNA-binding transcriptional regulator YiaG